MHLDRFPFMHENLLQEHPSDFARLNVGVGHKVPIGSISTCPAQTESLFFCGSRLDKHVACSRYFHFDATAQGLECIVSIINDAYKDSTNCDGLAEFCLDGLWQVFLDKELDRKS